MASQFLDEVEDFLWQGGDAVSSKVSLMLAIIKGAEIEMENIHFISFVDVVRIVS